MSEISSSTLVFGRAASMLLNAGGCVLLGIRLVLDLIGYSTVPEDVEVAKTRLDQFLDWVFELPWGIVIAFVLITTLWLMWVSWPRPIKAQSGAAENEGELNYETRLDFAELEMQIDPERFSAREIKSINVYDTTTLPMGDDTLILHVVFDDPLFDPTISVNVSKSTDAFKYVAEKVTSRFCAIKISGIEFPCTLWVDFQSNKLALANLR